MMTIEQFCEKHGACEPGQTWALANCRTMQEAWGTAPDPEWVVWIATRRGVLTERELRLFICFCARQNWHRLTDPRSRNVVDVAERYANGQASQEELVAAAREARAAVEVVWGTAAWTLARVAAWTAERVAAAWMAERVAAASGITATQQAVWLRKNTKPNFN
jgi:hypothetical protein